MAHADRTSKDPVKPGRNRPYPTEQELREREQIEREAQRESSEAPGEPGRAGPMDQRTRTGPLAGVSQDQDNTANQTANPDPSKGPGARMAGNELRGGVDRVARDEETPAEAVSTRAKDPKRDGGSREDSRSGGGADRGRGRTKHPRG